jgi:hypothetical protein
MVLLKGPVQPGRSWSASCQLVTLDVVILVEFTKIISKDSNFRLLTAQAVYTRLRTF